MVPFVRSLFLLADFKTDPRTLHSSDSEANGESQAYPSLRKFCITQREIAEPLLVFCTHGIRVRDTRCCSMTLRLFISLVPEFGRDPPSAKKSQSGENGNVGVDNTPIPEETASMIREYISSEVLKACISSFHEPYFVDLQKELASLIAAIVVHYSPITASPRDVLLSLPGVKPEDADRLGAYTARPGAHTRQQRSIVLDMLKDLKGVSVSEMGKVQKSIGFGGGGTSGRSKKTSRTRMAQAFMSAPEPQHSQEAGRPGGTNGQRGGTPEALEGVSNLFDS